MAHAHKGGISHSPGNNSRPQSNDTHHQGRRFALGRTKAITPNRPRRTAIPRRKTPLGGLTAAFSSLAVRKRDYGASRDASESQEKLEKERRSTKSDRKAANGAPNAMLNPCSEGLSRSLCKSFHRNLSILALMPSSHSSWLRTRAQPGWWHPSPHLEYSSFTRR